MIMPQDMTAIRPQPDHISRMDNTGGADCASCFIMSRHLKTLFVVPSEGHNAFRWRVHLLKLANAAESGCQFCGFMADRFFNDQAFTFLLTNLAVPPSTGCCGSAPKGNPTKWVAEAIAHLRRHSNEDTYITLLAESFERGQSASRFGKITLTAIDSNLTDADYAKVLGLRSYITLELYAKESDPGAAYVTTRPMSVDPTSKESIAWANSQISKCFKEHSGCPAFTTTSLPTRVVRISNDGKVRIIEGGGVGSYIALSYCWGGPQAFSTTTETLNQSKSGFAIESLPKTLRDAIILTKRLGIKNIWIDSLCILQDSQVDKNIEIPKMSEYYQNSYVTICAASSSCHDGFMAVHGECKEHPGSGIPRDLLQMRYYTPKNELGTLYFREERPYCLSDEQISFRGWTLQERVLSPRSLTYGHRHLWQCNQQQSSEGGCEDWSFDLRSSGNRRLQLDFVRAFERVNSQSGQIMTDQTTPNGGLDADTTDFWYRIVEEYSTRQLSVASDKLPAISALAEGVSRVSGDVYVAGLWRGQLLRDLMWHTRPNPRPQRHEPWCAPTWSWASVRNKVSYRDALPLNAIPVAEIVSCDVVVASAHAPFGTVERGELTIRAPLALCMDTKFFDSVIRREHVFPELSSRDGGLSFRRDIYNYLGVYQRLGKPNGQAQWDKHEKAGVLLLFTYQEDEDSLGAQNHDHGGNSEGKKGSREDTIGVASTEPTDITPAPPDGSSTMDRRTANREGECSEATEYRECWAGLIVVERDDGKYERIGCLNKLIVRGNNRDYGVAQVYPPKEYCLV